MSPVTLVRTSSRWNTMAAVEPPTFFHCHDTKPKLRNPPELVAQQSFGLLVSQSGLPEIGAALILIDAEPVTASGCVPVSDWLVVQFDGLVPSRIVAEAASRCRSSM